MKQTYKVDSIFRAKNIGEMRFKIDLPDHVEYSLT